MNKIPIETITRIVNSTTPEAIAELVFQSSHFPDLKVTKEFLLELRQAFPAVTSFNTELLMLESKMLDDRSFIPKRNWRTKINNWMQVAEQRVKERKAKLSANKDRFANYGDNKIPRKESATSLQQVLLQIPVEPIIPVNHIADDGKMVVEETKPTLTVEEQRKIIIERFG